MAQPPPDQNFYHHTLPHPHPHPHPHPPPPHSHPHSHPHPHPHPHSHSHPQHPQLQLPPQFRNPFDLLFDERTGAINYNYIRPYLPNQIPKPDELSDSLVMRRPRRTRTTFTSSQIAELEQHFLQGRYLTAPRLADLSAKLALGTAQVKIWFKNRRRRHKIQSDQHKDQSYDGMPMSPSMPNAPPVKAEVDPPSLHALTLGGGGGAATPNALTPSPTPTTPTAHLVEHYNEAFGVYYNYNNHAQPQQQEQQRHMAQLHGGQYGGDAATFFQHAEQQQQQQQQILQQQQQQQQQLHHHHAMAQQQQQQQHQQQQSQQQYHHFDFQQKSGNACRMPFIKCENEDEYNYNGAYYMRATTALALSGVAAGSTGRGHSSSRSSSNNTNNNSSSSNNNLPAVEAVAAAVTSAMSPGSEVYEPLTPKNDESPSLCAVGTAGGGVGVGVGGQCATAVGAVEVNDDMDNGPNEKTMTLQNLEPLKGSNNLVTDKACDNGSDILASNLLAAARGNLIGCGSNGSSAFGKFGKLTAPGTQTSAPSAIGTLEAMHETSQYQCTMDTLMQAYNPHRNGAGNNQFAYCFN